MPAVQMHQPLRVLGFMDMTGRPDLEVVGACFDWRTGDKVFAHIKGETLALDEYGKLWWSNKEEDLVTVEFENRTDQYKKARGIK